MDDQRYKSLWSSKKTQLRREGTFFAAGGSAVTNRLLEHFPLPRQWQPGNTFSYYGLGTLVGSLAACKWVEKSHDSRVLRQQAASELLAFATQRLVRYDVSPSHTPSHISMSKSTLPMTNSCAVVIPARLASTRLPRKLLLDDTGRPLIQHTYEAAATALSPSLICVATEDEAIRRAVADFGGNCLMTSPGLASGTERVAEVVAQSLTHVDFVVNVQGDEPEIEGAAIDLLTSLLVAEPQIQMATLAAPIRNERTLRDPACVKVVSDEKGRALYFSRSPIPYPRDGVTPEMFQDPALFYQHLGIYAYRREFLLQYGSQPASPLEQTECLEQLRVLAAGVSIRVGIVPQATPGIDTPADYRRFVAAHRRRSGQAA